MIRSSAMRPAPSRRPASTNCCATNGFTEQIYVREQRATILRQQIAEMVVGAVTAPGALQELGHRLRNERRNVTFARLPLSAAGEIAAPGDAQLKTYFDERKTAFRAPEYRTADVLAISAETLADAEQDQRRRGQGPLRAGQGAALHHGRDPHDPADRLPQCRGGAGRQGADRCGRDASTPSLRRATSPLPI